MAHLPHNQPLTEQKGHRQNTMITQDLGIEMIVQVRESDNKQPKSRNRESESSLINQKNL